MSLSSFVISGTSKIGFGVLDVDELDIDDVEFNPSGGGSGGGSVAGALAFTNNTPQSIPNGGNTNVILGSSDVENTFGTTSLSTVLDGSSHIIGIKNTGSNTINVLVTGYCSFNGVIGGNYAIWINKNGSDSDRYGLTEGTGDNDFIVEIFTCSLQMAVNDYIHLRAWSTGGSVSVSNGAFTPALRLIVTQLNEGTGGGSVTITGDSSLDITTSGSNVALSNCGKTWANFDAVSDINVNGNNITGALSLQINGVTQTVVNNVLTLECTDGSNPKIYDDTHYKPSLSSVLIASNNAFGHDAIGLNNIVCNNINVTTINNSAYPPSSNGGGSVSNPLIIGSSNSATASVILQDSTLLGENRGYALSTGVLNTVGTFGIDIIDPENIPITKDLNSFTAFSNGTVYLSGNGSAYKCNYPSGYSANPVKGQIYDETFYPPLSRKSWINTTQGSSLFSNSPLNIGTFVNVDATQSFNTSKFKLTQMNITQTVPVTYQIPSYYNATSSPVTFSGSLMMSFLVGSASVGLIVSYIPSTMVTPNGAGRYDANGTFSYFTNMLNSCWQSTSGNTFLTLPFSGTLQAGDFITFTAVSSSNDWSISVSSLNLFGVNPVPIYSRLTLTTGV